MKKLSLLFGILLIGLFVKAHSGHGKSDLKLKLWNNSSFEVFIDNYRYDKTTSIKIGNLSPGNHKIRIIKRSNGHFHNNHSGHVKLLYKGVVKIPKNSVVSAIVTPHHGLRLNVKKKHHNNHGSGYGHSGGGNGCNSGGHGHSGCGNGNHGYSGGGYDFGQNNDCNHYGECNSSCGLGSNFYGNGFDDYGMNDNSFNQLYNTINNAVFDKDKLVVANQAILYNNLNTNQVIMLMGQFTFDSSKLEFTKMAFNKTIDKENYYLVSNGFTFSRSKNKLIEYINNYS